MLSEGNVRAISRTGPLVEWELDCVESLFAPPASLMGFVSSLLRRQQAEGTGLKDPRLRPASDVAIQMTSLSTSSSAPEASAPPLSSLHWDSQVGPPAQTMWVETMRVMCDDDDDGRDHEGGPSYVSEAHGTWLVVWVQAPSRTPLYPTVPGYLGATASGRGTKAYHHMPPEVPPPETLYDYAPPAQPRPSSTGCSGRGMSPETVYPIAGCFKGAETVAMRREKEMEEKLALAERRAQRANSLNDDALRTAEYEGQIQVGG